MKTDHELAKILKNMMATKPIDEISASSICKKCGINRQTFYYHFHNIYDLLSLVYLDENINNIEEAKNIKEMIRAVYTYYCNNSSFIKASLESMGKDLFLEFIYNNIYKCFIRFINALSPSKSITNNDIKNIARFYAQAYSDGIVFYINTHKSVTFDGVSSIFGFVGDNVLKEALVALEKKKKK